MTFSLSELNCKERDFRGKYRGVICFSACGRSGFRERFSWNTPGATLVPELKTNVEISLSDDWSKG